MLLISFVIVDFFVCSCCLLNLLLAEVAPSRCEQVGGEGKWIQNWGLWGRRVARRRRSPSERVVEQDTRRKEHVLRHVVKVLERRCTAERGVKQGQLGVASALVVVEARDE